jgi:rhodanese-related sulfurtransferase
VNSLPPLVGGRLTVFIGEGPVSSGNATLGYAGDIDVSEAWALLTGDPKAQLVDVRTAAEWSFVGLPDLSGLGRQTHCVEWQRYPDMAVDPDFAARTSELLARAGATKDTPVVFLCRSGARSRAAAIAMTGAGFTRAFNAAGGFEGDLDAERHRGSHNGWKASNLPWKQS